MTIETTRRAILTGAPAAAVALAIPATAAPTADRREWEAAFADLIYIKAEDDAFTPGWMDAWRRCKAECDAIPHVTFPPEAYMGGGHQTTADIHAVRLAQRDVELLDAGKMRVDDLPGLREHYANKRKLVEAADERERQAQAVRNRYDMDRLDERAEALGDAIAEAESRLMDMPAPDLAALRWKLGKFRDEDGDSVAWSADYIEQTFADIARLLPEGR